MPKPKAMPKWTRAPEELIRLFDRALSSLPHAERRKMFGYPAAFVNGNLFAGLFQDKMMLRLSPTDLPKFLKLAGAERFEPVAGRVMREYAVAPPAILKSRTQLDDWLAKSFAYAASLPPKVGKKR